MRQKIQFLIASMLFLLATPAALTAYGQPMLTFTAQNGTITAKAGSTVITSGATVAQGTTLTFTLTPNQEYTLSSLTTQQFIFGEDFQVNNRSVGIDTGTDVTASATYSASTGAYTYTCTMPANNFDVRAVFTLKPIAFADANVKALCVANWDTNDDGELSFNEAAAVTSLGEVFKGNTEITSLDELQYFTGLTDSPLPVHFALSTWKTSAKYDNIVITSDGTTLYQNDFSNESLTDWTNGGGQWQVVNGALCQTNTGMEGNLFTLNSLTLGNNYTIDLDATKVEGDEGFLISFNVADADNRCWWNIGGWSNTKTQLEERIGGINNPVGNESSQTVENGRTYHITIAVNNGNVKCYLDGTLMHEYDFTIKIGNPLYQAFQGCSNLASVVMPENITEIGDFAFDGCTGLSSVIIPSTVTTIGVDAFSHCPMTTVTIPESVEIIRNWAFSDCGVLTSVTIPESVTSLGQGAFSCCYGLTSVNIPNSITSISEHAFAHCSALTSVEIPNSVTSIGQYAFQYCSNLTDLVIPSSVSSIGWGAFEQTPQLASIVVDDANTTFDSRDNCNAIIETATNTLVAACKNTVIPNTITAIGGVAFCGITGLTSVTIPNSVTSIGEGSFNGCTNLTEIHWTPNADTDLSSSLASANLTSTDRTLYLYKNADNAAMVDNVVSGYDGQFEEIIVVSESITIEVLATGVTLNQSAITLTTAGETATLTATVAPADVTDGSVTWTSSNTSVATVNSEGVVTAVANGTATITATTNDGTNIAASCAITVNISEPDTDISQLDNVVYMESTDVSAGSEETLSIKMKNTVGIQTLQFDLYLPEGVEVLTDEDDFDLIELSTERTTARKMDQFSVQHMSNGAYRVLINSTRGYTFDGTDGEIATVQVGVSGTMTPGSYPVIFRDIVLVTTNSEGYETAYVKCSLNIPDYKPGDVNNDNKVNAIDLNAITNYILERRDFPFSFNKKAANINGDKESNGDEKINAIDLNAVTNMILNEGATTSGANRLRVILIPD